MNTILSLIIIISSVALVFLVFAQNPKGGGLSSDFGAATQLGGVQKTNDVIDKTTWSLAGIIAIVSIILTVRMTPKQVAPQQTQDAGGAQTEMPADMPDQE